MKALPLLFAVFMLLVPVAGAVNPVMVAGGANADGLTERDPAGLGSIDDADGFLQTDTDDGNGDTGVDTDDGDNETDGTLEQVSEDPDTLTLRVLSPPPDAETRIGIHGHDGNLGTSLGLEVAAVDAALETTAVERRIESADDVAERQRRILAAVNQVEQDEVSLYSRQNAAINAHASGELSDRELLDELVRISAIAREYDERLDVLDELAEGTDGFSAPSRLDELQVQLQMYEGPVRDHALETVRGGTHGSEVHIESSNGAVALAIIDEAENEYVREAFRDDRWDRGGGSVSSEDAINATATSYPETAALREADAFGAGSVQRITISHEFGELRTFVSGGTNQVFVEYQRMTLDDFPDFETVSTSEDGFNVTVDRSYPGGPVKVTVEDDEQGDPVTGVTVTRSVGGESESIGSTDRDGVVWTLSPADSYRINVVDEPRVAVIDGIAPTDVPRVADERPVNGTDGDGE